MKSNSKEQIVQDYGEVLQAFIRSRVGSKAIADDLLQEVWYQLSKLTDLAQIKNHKAWLYQVARNKIIDHYRKKIPDWLDDYLMEQEEYGNNGFLTDFYTPEEAYWREEFWETFYEALEQLPENQRSVFVQNELEDLTLREIAIQSNTNLKTIISRKGYAIRRLREHLQVLFDDLD
ncbi:MAG: RNA polymerase sigma factor [Bacteroidota bacterium]